MLDNVLYFIWCNSCPSCKNMNRCIVGFSTGAEEDAAFPNIKF